MLAVRSPAAPQPAQVGSFEADCFTILTGNMLMLRASKAEKIVATAVLGMHHRVHHKRDKPGDPPLQQLDRLQVCML